MLALGMRRLSIQSGLKVVPKSLNGKARDCAPFTNKLIVIERSLSAWEAAAFT